MKEPRPKSLRGLGFSPKTIDAYNLTYYVLVITFLGSLDLLSWRLEIDSSDVSSVYLDYLIFFLVVDFL